MLHYRQWRDCGKMDADPGFTVDEIGNDRIQPLRKTGQLFPEASIASLPSRRRHWREICLHTHIRKSGSRLQFHQVGYSPSDAGDDATPKISDKEEMDAVLTHAEILDQVSESPRSGIDLH